MRKLIKVLGFRFLALFLFSIGISFTANGQVGTSPQIVKGLAGDPYTQVTVPTLSSRVTDLTGTLTPTQMESLEQKLTSFESSKGSQIAVLIVPTTKPEEIEQYSIRVTDKWKLGRKGVDDGILLLIAKDDHKMRIEVGRGLEGALPDVYARRIIGDVIAPFFKQDQYYGGINAGLDQIIRIVNAESLPEPHVNAGYGADGNMEGLLLIAFMFSLFLGSILKNILGKSLGGIATGGIVGFLAFLMTGLIGIAIIAGLVGLIASMMGGLGGRGGPIFIPGGGFGGRGGLGGGGFGGGGGGFGGGGASGGW
jgi:uncharacterized protein